MFNPTLQKAAEAHRSAGGSIPHNVIVGANFVECLTCGAHAHLGSDGKLIAHGAAGMFRNFNSVRYHTLQTPEEFAHEPAELVDPADQCPYCGECRVDYLICRWEEGVVECASCGKRYNL